MTRTKKLKSKVINRDDDIDSFNRFCLQHRDHQKEPFFIMSGTQVVQNYRCSLELKSVTDAYRLSLK